MINFNEKHFFVCSNIFQKRLNWYQIYFPLTHFLTHQLMFTFLLKSSNHKLLSEARRNTAMIFLTGDRRVDSISK